MKLMSNKTEWVLKVNWSVCLFYAIRCVQPIKATVSGSINVTSASTAVRSMIVYLIVNNIMAKILFR